MARRIILWIWWPVLLRFSVFSFLTLGSSFYAQVEGKTSADFKGFGWVEWSTFWIPILLAWFGVALAFLDQTIAKLREQGISETEYLAKRFKESMHE